MADYFKPDKTIPSQYWVCISIISPESFKDHETCLPLPQSSKLRAVKIRGCFATYEEACEQAKSLNDPYFNVYVGKVGEWLPFVDDDCYAEDIEYKEKELNNLFKSYKEHSEKGKEYHEQYKKKKIDELLSKNERKQSTREKLCELKQTLSSKEEDFSRCKMPSIQDKKDVELLREMVDDVNQRIAKDEADIEANAQAHFQAQVNAQTL